MLPTELPFRAVFKQLPKLAGGRLEIFRTEHFQPGVPVTLTGFSDRIAIPAIHKWFVPLSSPGKAGAHKLNDEHFGSRVDTLVPLERTECLSAEPNDHTFERLTAPLSVFTSWTNTKLENPATVSKSVSLYLAQCEISDLPWDLRNHLPSPQIVKRVGKGDIYASSLWMGIPPMNTPLHRDPNPNVLIQLAGRKTVRMLHPGIGRAIYEHATRLCAEAAGKTSHGGGSIRGEEMMVGLERKVLDNLMWGEHSPDTPEISGLETTLASGEGVFIPKGWWHSVRGLGSHEDGINASRRTGGFDDSSSFGVKFPPYF